MKNRSIKRNVTEHALQHVYKICSDGGVVFYRTVDHLVYFTIESVMSMRYKIPVLARCQMFNHTHKLCAPSDQQQLAACESNINIAFTREYNKEYGRKGRLFRGPFGSAPKWSDKVGPSRTGGRFSLITSRITPSRRSLCSQRRDGLCVTQ